MAQISDSDQPPTAGAPLRAALLMVAALTFFSCMGVFVRLSSEELPTFVVVFFRNLLAFAFLAPLLWRHAAAVRATQRLRLHALRAVVGVAAMTTGFAAVALIPLAEATAINFTTPLFATIGAVLLLGERIRLHRTAALGVGFVGMLVVLEPWATTLSLGAGLALANAALIAGSTLLVKRLTATESPAVITIWMAILYTPASLIPALFVWVWPSWATLGWLFLLAGCGTAGHLCWARATSLSEVTQLQPLVFLKLPMVVALGYVIFAEIPRESALLGGGIIFAATAYVTHREARLARAAGKAPRTPAAPGPESKSVV